MTSTPDTIRIAMWSGPRNISTALMRSFGNRPDTVVCDEPFYAHYLEYTGYEHPGRDEIVERHETDWRRIVHELSGPLPSGKSVHYQKHMAHHMLEHVDRTWLLQPQFRNALLIRDPREMLLSLIKILPEVTAEQTGLPQQLELFRFVCENAARPPIVIHAQDVLHDPESMLREICGMTGIRFLGEMLNWPSGPRDTDGVWGAHWYGRLYQTTGFGRHEPKDEPLPEHFHEVLHECEAIYDQLEYHRLRAA